MPKAETSKEQVVKSRREERAQGSAPYPAERMGAVASMLEDGDGTAYMNPADLEARTAALAADGAAHDDADEGGDKPSFEALTASELNVRILSSGSRSMLVRIHRQGPK